MPDLPICNVHAKHEWARGPKDPSLRAGHILHQRICRGLLGWRHMATVQVPDIPSPLARVNDETPTPRLQPQRINSPTRASRLTLWAGCWKLPHETCRNWLVFPLLRVTPGYYVPCMSVHSMGCSMMKPEIRLMHILLRTD